MSSLPANATFPVSSVSGCYAGTIATFKAPISRARLPVRLIWQGLGIHSTVQVLTHDSYCILQNLPVDSFKDAVFTTRMDNSSIPRLRAISSTKRSLQAYTTIASDDVELSNIDGPTMYRRDQSTLRRMPPQPAQPRVRFLWKTALAVVRSFPCGRCALHMPLFFMVSGLIVVIALIAVLPKIFAVDREDFCTPDGAFELSSHPYTPWKRDGILQLT